MTDHTAAWRSSTSGETGQQRSGVSGSVPELTQQTREQVSQAGDYLASKAQEYPLAAVLIAGLVGYGLGSCSIPAGRARPVSPRRNPTRTCFGRRDTSSDGKNRSALQFYRALAPGAQS